MASLSSAVTLNENKVMTFTLFFPLYTGALLDLMLGYFLLFSSHPSVMITQSCINLTVLSCFQYVSLTFVFWFLGLCLSPPVGSSVPLNFVSLTFCSPVSSSSMCWLSLHLLITTPRWPRMLCKCAWTTQSCRMKFTVSSSNRPTVGRHTTTLSHRSTHYTVKSQEPCLKRSH